MSILWLAALSRFLLAGVFLTAGIAKWRRVVGTEGTVIDLGIPRFAKSAVLTGIPVLEVFVGLMLLLNRFNALAASLAFCLLVLFSLAIAANLIAGRRPSCGCFGELTAKPMSWWTVARNLGLVGLCLMVAYSQPIRLDDLVLKTASQMGVGVLATTGFIGLTCLVLCQTALIVWLLQRRSRLLNRLTMLEAPSSSQQAVVQVLNSAAEPGLVAPPFQVMDSAGQVFHLEDFRRYGTDIVLLFVDPACVTCSELLADIARWQRDLSGQLFIALISRSVHNSVASPAHLRNEYFENDREVSRLFGIHGTPAAIVIRVDGSIAGAASFGRAAIAASVIAVGAAARRARPTLTSEAIHLA